MSAQTYTISETPEPGPKKAKITKYLLQNDNFAELIHPHYDGLTHLPTRCGGAATLCINVWLLCVGIWYFAVIIGSDLYELRTS